MLRITLFLAALAATASAWADEPAVPTTRVPELIRHAGPYTPDGALREEPSFRDKTKTHRIESGSVNGVRYEFYYTDGSGTFAGAEGNTLSVRERPDSNWHVSCKQDAMTDAKFCYVQRGGLWIWVYPGRLKVHVTGKDELYPGSSAAVRVDGNPPMKTAADGEGVFGPKASQALIAQLKAGEKVTVRIVGWPYGDAQDVSFPLYGFDEALAYAQWALKHM